MVVLFKTPMGAPAATNATGKVQGVAKLDTVQRSDVAQVRPDAIVFFGLCGEVGQDALDIFGRKFSIVLLEQIVERNGA